MKKTNFTNPKLVNSWLLVLALIFTSFSLTKVSAQCQLNADDHIHVILSDDNCDATLTQEMFLSADGIYCTVADHYEFEVRSADGANVLIPMTENAVLDQTFIGGPYMIIIEAHDANHVILNTAMTTFDVADKMPPIIDCPTDTMNVACWQDDATLLTATENCSDYSFVWTDEVVTSNDCSIGPNGLNWPWYRFKQIERTYVAVDGSGNQSTPCTVTLNVNAFDFGTDPAYVWGVRNFENVAGTAISCVDADSYKDAEGNFDPNKTGWPQLIYWDETPTPFETAALDFYDTVDIDNNCTFNCNLASTYIDVKVNTCPKCVEKVVRLWTVVETSCMHPERIVHIDAQHIEVYDTIDPVIVCPDNMVITTNTIGNFEPTSAGDLDCGAMFTFPVPIITDECHNYTTWTISVTNDLGLPIMFADSNETKTPVNRALPFGLNTVKYIAYDKCGNSSECTWTINVVDNTPPVAICQQFTTVSLTYDGEAEIAAYTFDSGSYDDCVIDHFEVRRMDGKIDCEGNTDELFHPYVRFCCDDIVNNDITVIMRAFGKSPNSYNDCMVQVNVQDKLPPQITCPPSICVECDYTFDINNLEEYFGTVVQGYENREENTIYGDYGALYNNYMFTCGQETTNLKFKDGWAHDNCGLEITPSYVDNRDQCNNGDIVRTFIASDPNGSVNCTQTIHFYNPDPFDVEDITWPLDKNITACTNEAAYDPDVTGWPVLVEDNCDLVAANYNDLVFHFNDDNFDAESVCFKIIRRWTVMDWCQRYPDVYPANPDLAGTYYTWHHDQVIMISEFDPPTFTSDCEDKETKTYDVLCESGYIELNMSATDECTQSEDLKWRYQIDYNNDGSFDIDSKNFLFPNNIISGPSASATGTYPIGKHRIVWSVWDQCGNIAVCDKFFTIKNAKKPTPICIDHIAIEMMPIDTDNDGEADWAMIDVGPQLVEHCCTKSSHPCNYPLLYSFSSDVDDTLRTYDCEDKGLQEVQMWVTAVLPDSTFTQDYCITHIDFQDNTNVCPATQGITVSGTVSTINEDPISNVEIDLQGSEMAPRNTNDNGTFAFEANSDRNYILSPSKDGDDLNGISTLDLVLIQKHVLGLKTIENPYQLLAANAKHDDKISAADILTLRKLILGDTDDIGESWLFIAKDYQFENPANPYNENLPTDVAINSDENLVIDYYGIKMGDVNTSLNILESRSAEKLVLATNAMELNPGQIEVPVYAENFNNVNGFQYTINFDASVMNYTNIESGALTLNNSNIGLSKVKNGVITMSWNNAITKNISPTEPLFTMSFNVNKAAKLQDVMSINSEVTKKEAYNAELEVMDIELQYRNAGDVEFALYQNTPNPFSVSTEINFTLPEGSNGTISIYDLNGKVVKVINGTYNKGMNSVKIKKSDLNVTGVMYYRLETEGFTATKKMILIK